VYRPVTRAEIADALVHIRDLYRQIKPPDEQEYRASERREVGIKNLLSNLPRTKEHPTLNTVDEVANMALLTIEGAHRLFGYDLARIREYDLRLNGGRTHIECPHKSLRPGEIHRSLGMSDFGDAGESNRKKSWPHHADGMEKIPSGKGLRQSLGKLGCLTENDGIAWEHRHLQRPCLGCDTP